jgi:hypothetical protein
MKLINSFKCNLLSSILTNLLSSVLTDGTGKIKKCENRKKDKKIPFTFENKWGIISVLRNILFKITRVRVLSLSLSNIIPLNTKYLVLNFAGKCVKKRVLIYSLIIVDNC